MGAGPGKYIQLFITIFFSIVTGLISIVLFLLLFRLVFGLLTYMPWISFGYMLMILLFPAVLFITVYVIYFRRTGNHPLIWVRTISRSLFVIAILAWLIFLILDLQHFFKTGKQEIAKYLSYNLLFLYLNIVLIIFSGVIQALTMPAEKDWLEKRAERENEF